MKVYKWCFTPFIQHQMSQRKAWTKQEDQLLVKIMNENGQGACGKKWKWNQIGDKISELSLSRSRSGKQCRQRWFNQLHPGINRESEWSRQEEEGLFRLQAQYGNKWAKIATHIAGRSDNNIKNYFYSTLRKAIRRVNNYVAYHKRSVVYKNLKAFQSNTLNKILTVAQNRADRKIIVGKQSAASLAKDIRDSLIRIQTKYTEDQINQLNQIMDELIIKMQDFNKICKRRKTKKKDIPNQQNSPSENYQPSLPIPSNNQSNNALEQSILHQSYSALQIQGLKDKNENKPLHRNHSGQSNVREEKWESFKQVESQLLNEDKKITQPLIPSIQSSNSFIHFPLAYRSFQRTQESQSLQSNSLHYDQSFNQHTPNINFIPFAQPNIFAGSPFFPAPFYPNPFMSYPQPSNASQSQGGFQMNWSQQYAANKNEEFNPFVKTNLNILQMDKEIHKGKQ